MISWQFIHNIYINKYHKCTPISFWPQAYESWISCRVYLNVLYQVSTILYIVGQHSSELISFIIHIPDCRIKFILPYLLMAKCKTAIAPVHQQCSKCNTTEPLMYVFSLLTKGAVICMEIKQKLCCALSPYLTGLNKSKLRQNFFHFVNNIFKSTFSMI